MVFEAQSPKKQNSQTATMVSPKLRRSKSRDVSSRFLESTPSSPVGNRSPVQTLAPPRLKPDKNSRLLEDPAMVSLRSLWPSTSTPTFGDHLGRDRLDDALERNAKENRRPAARLDDGNASFRGQSSPREACSRSARRRSGVEVASRYASTSRSGASSVASAESSKSPVATVRRVRSLSMSGSSDQRSPRTQWAMSPGRSAPSSPSRSSTGSVEKLLNIGLGFFKTKKSSSPEIGHRLLYNRLIQWRFANARADCVNVNVAKHVERNLVCGWDGLRKLRHSVVQKKIQLQRLKLDMKLTSVLQSQLNLLEIWGDMERQHMATLRMTRESLLSVACRVPLVQGAKVELPSARIAVRQALDLASSLESKLTRFSAPAEKNVQVMSKLAKVVAQEKLLVEECLELVRTISNLEIEERSLKCGVTQMGFWQKHQKHEEINCWDN